MAIINCPECGKEVSDKATACPNCGCPISEHQADVHQDEITSVSSNSKPKKKIWAIIAAIIAVVAIGCYLFSVNKAAEQAKDKERFIELATSLRLSGLKGGSECETVCNLIKGVWSDTINTKYHMDTAPYVMNADNTFNKDFNKSLSNLFASDTYKDSIDIINSAEDELREYLSEMDTISEDYQQCYDAAESFCKMYYNFADLATSPSGSLISFSESCNSLDSDMMQCYEDFDYELEKLSNDQDNSAK